MKKQLPKPEVTIVNAKLQSNQRYIALATIFIPLIGTIVAIARAYLNGVTHLEVGLLIVFFILTNLGIEFGLHRNLAHRSFETIPIIGGFFVILGTMAAQGRVIYWVANHRRHHIHSDTVDDPHSPHIRKNKSTFEVLSVIKGLWHAHIGHMLTDKVTNCSMFAADLNRNSTLVKINQMYFSLVIAGILFPGFIAYMATHSFAGFVDGILWGGLMRIFLVHQVTWSVASLTHRFGTRCFETHDHSANNAWIAIPSFGSGWQNNHHAFPSSAYIGIKWWEIDITGWLIHLLEWSNLAWNVKKPTTEQILNKSIKNSAHTDMTTSLDGN